MGKSDIYTDLDLHGAAVLGMATAAPGTATQQGASTEFVALAVKKGSARWQDILPLQPSGLLTGVLGVEAVIAGSDFVWSADYLPAGRSVYLETYASGSALTTLVTVTLYATSGINTGLAVVGASTSTSNTTTGALVRSGAFTLTDGVSYQLRFKAAVLGTGTLKLARLIIL